jgi:hypothetical protein
MKKNSIPILGCLFIVSVLAIVLFSCKKSTTVSPEIDSKKQGAVYEYIKKLGYKDSEIKDIGDEYLVDGDILFSKKSQPDFSIFDGPRTEQYGTSNYIGYFEQPDIRIYIDPSLSGLVSEIQGAVALWNNVPNCRVDLSASTDPADYDILITNVDLDGACGEAYFPQNGRAGALIKIDVAQISGNSFAQRQRTIAHEIGHTIGFRHTNWIARAEPLSARDDAGAYVDATHILGTPTGNDPSSLMNGGQCGIGAVTLSNFDILAVQFLYPENPPVAGTVPVFRYYNKEHLQKHFFTTDYNELGDGNNNGFIFEGIGFFAFPNQVANSVGVHRWYLPTTSDHFYTTDPNESNGGTYEGVRFYVYPSAINGAVPVHGYYWPTTGNHFYTKNQSEVAPGPNYDGIRWYAY